MPSTTGSWLTLLTTATLTLAGRTQSDTTCHWTSVLLRWVGLVVMVTMCFAKVDLFVVFIPIICFVKLGVVACHGYHGPLREYYKINFLNVSSIWFTFTVWLYCAKINKNIVNHNLWLRSLISWFIPFYHIIRICLFRFLVTKMSQGRVGFGWLTPNTTTFSKTECWSDGKIREKSRKFLTRDQLAILSKVICLWSCK